MGTAKRERGDGRLGLPSESDCAGVPSGDMTNIGGPRWMHRGLDALAKLNGLVATLLFVALTVVVALQVLTRFVLHLPFIWSEEAARFLFFWVALLGAAMSVRARRHFALDVTAGRRAAGRPALDITGAGTLSTSARVRGIRGRVRLPDLIPDACVLAFSVLLMVQGIGYVGVGWLRTASNSQVNMGLVYAAIPVFAVLSALYAAGNLIVDVAALRAGSTPGTGKPPTSASPPTETG